MHKKITFEEFKEKATEVHGDKYIYSKLERIRDRTTACIICNETDEHGNKHGEFYVSPHSHIARGQGCPICSKIKRSERSKYSQEEWIEKVEKIHNYKYDYSKVNYINLLTPVLIICPEHGEFHQRPSHHAHGKGCPICGFRKKSHDTFINELNKLKPNISVISEYKGVKESILVKCNIDGYEWKTTPWYMLKKDLGNCPECVKLVNKNEFIRNANIKHNNKYDYSKVNYLNVNTKVCIICPEHGEFWQIPKDHLRNGGCDKCGRELSIKGRTKPKEDFLLACKQIHGDYYNFSNINYTNTMTKISVICPEHGEFTISPEKMLTGQGCRLCGINKATIKKTKTRKQFLEECYKSHTGYTYDYSKSEYKSDKALIRIICHKKDENGDEHGEFWQTPGNHISKSQGCPICGRNKSVEARRYTTEEWIKKAIKTHGNLYNYSLVDYTSSEEKVPIICQVHGTFYQKPSNHLMGQGCVKCFREKSWIEREICDYVSSLGVNFTENNRIVLEGKEIDIYIPEHNIGIEVNGLIWHSELHKPDKNYHLNKTKLSEKKELKLIHVFEDEWKNKKEIAKSRIANLLNKTTNKVFARKCQIKEINANEAKIFLDQNHIQGNVNSKIKIGLFYNGNLVSLMTFGRQRKIMGGENKENEYEMLRFCNEINTNVIGGASKLLSFFIKNYNPKKIISYADRRWSQGNLYEKLNFSFVKNTRPNYFYIVNKERKHRFNYRKDILIKEGFDPNKTEHEIMLDRKIYRIYDCGTKLFKLDL